MASRPVYRGSCRMEETKVPFHPVKGSFGRMGSISTPFRPPKGRFARMGRSQEVRIIILADGRPVALVLLGDSRSLAKCCRGFRQFTLARRMA